MARPLIFLDIDGVLNSTEWCLKRPHQGLVSPTSAAQAIREERLDPGSVGYLNQLVAETNARLVLSSSWRLRMAMSEFAILLEHFGVAPTALLGSTEQLTTEPDSLHRVIRGDEVAKWRHDHDEGCAAYLCLDDGTDYHPDQPLVQTNPDFGLTPAEVAACLKILPSIYRPHTSPP